MKKRFLAGMLSLALAFTTFAMDVSAVGVQDDETDEIVSVEAEETSDSVEEPTEESAQEVLTDEPLEEEIIDVSGLEAEVNSLEGTEDLAAIVRTQATVTGVGTVVPYVTDSQQLEYVNLSIKSKSTQKLTLTPHYSLASGYTSEDGIKYSWAIDNNEKDENGHQKGYKTIEGYTDTSMEVDPTKMVNPSVQYFCFATFEGTDPQGNTVYCTKTTQFVICKSFDDIGFKITVSGASKMSNVYECYSINRGDSVTVKATADEELPNNITWSTRADDVDNAEFVTVGTGDEITLNNIQKSTRVRCWIDGANNPSIISLYIKPDWKIEGYPAGNDVRDDSQGKTIYYYMSDSATKIQKDLSFVIKNLQGNDISSSAACHWNKCATSGNDLINDAEWERSHASTANTLVLDEDFPTECSEIQYNCKIVCNGTYENYVFRFMRYSPNSVATSNTWNVSVEPSEVLYCNAVNQNNIIAVSASGTESYVKQKATFTSSNTNVIKLVAIEGTNKVAQLEPVAPGTATVTVKFAGTSKSYDITVEKKREISGIALSKSEITLNTSAAGEGTNYTSVVVSTTPAEMGFKGTPTFSSSDSSVANVTTMTDDPYRGYISAQGVGTATITATYTEDGQTYTATCNVKVVSNIPEGMLPDTPELWVITNIMRPGDRLADITYLGKNGWKWVDGTEEVKADDATPIQYFRAKYELDGYATTYKDIKVYVSKLKGIKASATASCIYNGATGKQYVVTPSFVGYQPSEDKVKLYIDQGLIKTTADDSKAAHLTVTQVASCPQKYNITATTDNYTKEGNESVDFKWSIGDSSFTTSASIKVLKAPVVDALTITNASDANSVSHEFANDTFTVAIEAANTSEKRNTLTLSVAEQKGGEEIGGEDFVPVNWSVSDSSVVSISTVKNNPEKAVVTIKKPGSATITATAKDTGKCFDTVDVVVRDFIPVLKESTVNLSYYGSHAMPLEFICPYDTVINSVAIDKNDLFTVNYNSVTKASSVDLVSGKEAKDFSGSNKCLLTVGTNHGEYYIPLTIKVAKSKPNVTFKNTQKANVFNTYASATYKINSNAKIANITSSTVTKGFNVSYDAYNGNLYVYAVGLTKDTIGEFTAKNSELCKKTLTITFDDYQSITKEITVPIENKPLKVNLENAILVGEADNVNVIMTNPVTKSIYYLTPDVSVVSKTAGYTATIPGTGAPYVNIKLTNPSRPGSYKLDIVNDSVWTAPVSVSGKITSAKNEKLVLSKTSVVLNSYNNLNEITPFVVGAEFSGTGSAFSSFTVAAKDKTTAEAMADGYFVVKANKSNKTIELGLNKVSDTIANKYKGKTMKLETVAKNAAGVSSNKVTLNVKIEKNAPTLTISKKGTINLADRSDYNKQLICTANIKNVTAQVKNVRITGVDASDFYCSYMGSGSEFRISADTSVPLNTKKQYVLTCVATLDNGMEISSDLKFKVSNTMPRIQMDKKSITLYKSVSNNTDTYTLTPTSNTAAFGSFSKVDDKTSKYFDIVTDTSAGTIDIKLNSSQKNSLKPGKYTVKVQVVYYGQASNSKPVTVSLPVVVK